MIMIMTINIMMMAIDDWWLMIDDMDDIGDIDDIDDWLLIDYGSPTDI
jgi:hypothetical protein